MNDTTEAAHTRGVQFQLSPLLLGSLIAGIASTIAVAIFAALSLRVGGPPPPAGTPLPLPPPPSPGVAAGLTISAGLCVLSWAGVLVAHARDQVLRRVTAVKAEIMMAMEEFGERRDTEGFLRAMRTAGVAAPSEVRPLHRIPPPSPPAD